MIGSDRNPFYRDGGPKERGKCRGREKARKRKREGSGLDITMIAGDEKKKGAGARRAVCGVQMPRVFQTAIDALKLVLSVRYWRTLIAGVGQSAL